MCLTGIMNLDPAFDLDATEGMTWSATEVTAQALTVEAPDVVPEASCERRPGQPPG